MSQDTQQLIGHKLSPSVKRDAIHIAVVPAICADKRLWRGQGVRIMDGKAYPSEIDYGQAHGIIDPFLKDSVDEGDIVFVFLLPGTVTGMRHHWQHPDIDKTPTTDPHEKWIREFAMRWNFHYDDLIEAATTPSETSWDNFITAQGIDLHSPEELGEDHDRFWSHLEAMTGKAFNQEHRERFGWSCSC